MRNGSAWTWTAALALALTYLPVALAETGWGGWIAPLLVLPFVLWTQRWFRWPDKGGLAAVFCRVLGSGFGKLLTIIYMVWAVVLGGVQVKESVRRVAATARWTCPWLLAAGIVLLAVWFTRGQPAACGDWSVPVLAGVLAFLVGVTLLGLMQVRGDNLLPLQIADGGTLGAVTITLGVLCVRVYGSFLEGEQACAVRHPLWVCGVLALLLMTVQGVLGTELSLELEDPLLALSRNVGVEGMFQRAESLLSAVLLTADVALLTLLLWAARCGMERVWPSCRGWWATAGLTVAMLVCALWPTGGESVLRLWPEMVAGVNLLLGFVVPLMLVGLERWKRWKTGAYIVPEDRGNGTY